MPARRKYSQELRERAVGLVQEAGTQDAYLSFDRIVIRVGQRVGVDADTLRGWTRRVAIDLGHRPGNIPSDEYERYHYAETHGPRTSDVANRTTA